MAKNYYDEGEEGGAMQSQAQGADADDAEGMEESGKSKPHSDEDEEHETALIPKALGAGKDFKAGEEIVLKIVHVYEGEYEVEYSYGEDEGKSNPKSQMDEADMALEKKGTASAY